jgi:D-glycero-D-manno-heptose 1,7-bisphosphate phosphatase
MSVEIAAEATACVTAPAPGLHLPVNSRLVALARETVSPIRLAAAVFLDRDGVLVRDVHYLRTPSQVEILPGVAPALRALEERFYLIIATNQSGIARGFFTEADLLAIHAEIVLRLREAGARIDAFYYCPHLVGCDCRKPAPGLLLRAKADWGLDLAGSAMIGDSARDVEAGRAAGLGTRILLDAETDLARAVRTILGGVA